MVIGRSGSESPAITSVSASPEPARRCVRQHRDCWHDGVWHVIESTDARHFGDPFGLCGGEARMPILLAAFILELHRRQGDSGTVEIALSRSDIADFLGLTIETVSRNLTKLRIRRIIELPEVHRLIIIDPDCLEALAAGECEGW